MVNLLLFGEYLAIASNSGIDVAARQEQDRDASGGYWQNPHLKLLL